MSSGRYTTVDNLEIELDSKAENLSRHISSEVYVREISPLIPIIKEGIKNSSTGMIKIKFLDLLEHLDGEHLDMSMQTLFKFFKVILFVEDIAVSVQDSRHPEIAYFVMRKADDDYKLSPYLSRTCNYMLKQNLL